MLRCEMIWSIYIYIYSDIWRLMWYVATDEGNSRNET